ncbi:flagellar hook capping FlgD N-terminal domain-containing protein [Rubellimicrobium aerolatum]|uniref:Basal-body rod modification protein FlgD n=1 Tax=Rubellimicrobium aerolatum TaxID=490979 RepID=A0ABW0SA15_9RHOB|nr:flagellar hook capping FlgD N-terminal domain-containing protein [Rubellimicrobium aerolatum]MBP1805056.1 flagellar basal-body rod modification protein FlgD [Rubellimicrobium aerolatum]
MDISTVTASTTTAASAASPTSPGVISSDFNTFLKMLTAQMQNQDPLNPTDSSDYATQLATFSGVEQQVKTNDLLNSLSAQLALSGLGVMAGWVGQEARAAMPARFDGSPVTIVPSVDSAADEAQLVVRDPSGREVARGAIPVSSEPVEWAGVGEDGSPLASGLYSFEVVSLKDGQVLGSKVAEVYGTVTEVRTENGATVLVMEGGATVASSAVTGLRRAG